MTHASDVTKAIVTAAMTTKIKAANETTDQEMNGKI